MGLPIERWARQATLLDTPPRRILDDIHVLVKYKRLEWNRINKEILRSGDPTALQGGFAGLPCVPPASSLASVTSLNGTVALWSSSLHSPINANAVQAPQAYRVLAHGTVTTSTSPGNLGFDPRVGTASTIGSAVSGTTLGASTNVALTASITNAFWVVHGDITIRSIGGPGANSSVFGILTYVGTQATSSGLAGPAAVGAGHNLIFGGTAATVDLSVAAGFSLGAVNTVTTITYVTQQVHFAAWN